jgi:phytoene desaturase
VKYDLGMNDLVYKPSLNWSEYMTGRVLSRVMTTKVLTPLRTFVRSYFTDPRIQRIMEFPSLFLGASPQRTPALYSLMNYADIALGTWYPMGGMGRVVEAMVNVAYHQGVTFRMGEEVERINVMDGHARGVITARQVIDADVVVAAADYHHVETELLPPEHRSYTPAYWDRRALAPGALLFFFGLDRSIPGLQHHTLFFDRPLDQHSADIHDDPRWWPQAPLFHVACPTKTDPSLAPSGHETMTVLIPVAAGLADDETTRERYFQIVCDRIQAAIGVDIRPHVVVKRSYCSTEFIADYHSFRGNAYGLANTLRQTGPSRPRMKSRRVQGLYFAGQLTVPGPGVPPALISGQVAADLVDRDFHSLLNERARRA